MVVPEGVNAFWGVLEDVDEAVDGWREGFGFEESWRSGGDDGCEGLGYLAVDV